MSSTPHPSKNANRLVHETSPYLLQHAYNPVDWFPWGEAALEKAVVEQKIILVSIGYAACHWCHVMERESFENAEVAEWMNRHFINIKVDREERPDIDHIYMDAVQAMTGSGGWPLNVFLTPDQKPFYGGTYFPPKPMYNRNSWLEVLRGVQSAWQTKSHEIVSQAENLTAYLQQQVQALHMPVDTSNTRQPDEVLNSICTNILQTADGTWGGFGRAPKFPQFFTIRWLLQYHHYSGSEAAKNQALLSLDKMLAGGIYDHVGGGIARYSTDNEWLAPHFEKMLYDNALLIDVLSDAFQITQNPRYEKCIRQTIGFLNREMKSIEGAYFTALDADSEGVEGKFYVWTLAEISTLLGPNFESFAKAYDVSEKGNWEGVNILRLLESPAALAEQAGLTEAEWTTQMEIALEQLLVARGERVRPGLDDKLLLGWNALLCKALAKAALALQDEALQDMAVNLWKSMENIFKSKVTDDALWMHNYKNGQSGIGAFLEEYAWLAEAAIAVYECTFETEYLDSAKAITQYAIQYFSDESACFFYFTHEKQQGVLVRKIEVYDGATPSGNSAMARVLFLLSIYFDQPEWEERGRSMLSKLMSKLEKYPGSFAQWSSMYLMRVKSLPELVVTGPSAATLARKILAEFVPFRTIMATDTINDGFPMLKGKSVQATTQIYWCEKETCQAPVDNLNDFWRLLHQVEK